MSSGVLDAVAALQAAADELCRLAGAGGLEALTDEGFTGVAREVEAIRRRLATVDYLIVTEVETRELPELHLARTSAGVLSRLWRLSPHEAHARVREATALGARRTLAGQVLDPLYPVTAEARRVGVLSGSQASLIVKTLNDLPDSLKCPRRAATRMRAAENLGHFSDVAHGCAVEPSTTRSWFCCSGMMRLVTIRRARAGDSDQIAQLWLRARRASVPAIPPPVHSDDEVREWFRTVVLPDREVWVTSSQGRVVALLVLDGDWVDQLYVAPEHTGCGLGSALIGIAKDVRPAGLQLWTFQANAGARRFYERHGFLAREETDGANEEGAPDMRYEWHR